MGSRLRQLARGLVPRAVRNWLRAPRASLAWLADAARFRAGQRPSFRLAPGVLILCHPAALRTAFAPVLADPAQREELDSFLRTIQPETVLFDIGAHFGLFTLASLRTAGPAARVVAVDASPMATRMLDLQTHLNGFERQVTIHQAAIGDAVGMLDLVSVGVLAAGYYTAAGVTHPASERVSVRATTIDALTAECGAPTHLKIDIEGHEAGALLGAQETLRAARPLVFLEVHGDLIRAAGGDPSTPPRLLADAGYALTSTAGHPITIADAAAAALTRIVGRPT